MLSYDEKLNFLKNLLGNYSYSKSTKEAAFFCPFCNHHKQKLSVNIENFKFHCWVCNIAGRDLVPILKKTGTQKDFDFYNKNFSTNKIEQPSDTNELENFKLELPDEFIPLYECKDSFYGKRFVDYLKARDIDLDIILRHKIGICESGRYCNRIIFSSFDKYGRVNYYTGRSLTGDLKYLSAFVPKGWKNHIIMNELNIDWQKPVIIVEGFIDAIKAGVNNVVPLFGSSLSDKSKLFEALIKNKSEIILALDADALDKSLNIAASLMRNDLSVRLTTIEPFNDIGEMKSEEAKIRIENAKNLQENDIFLMKMRKLWH